MDLLRFMVKFFSFSVVHAVIIWIFCFFFHLDHVLARVAPRALKEFVSGEDGEERRLNGFRKNNVGRALRAFLQMVVLEVLAAPILAIFSVGLALSDY
jgi:hypothetical protein